MTSRLERGQATLVPLARVEGGLVILRKSHTSYYGNYSSWLGQGEQMMTSKGRRGRFGQSGGARTCEAGARGAHRGEGWRGFRVVLKGTAPDLLYCAGAEVRTKRGGGGRRRAAGGGARPHGSIFAEIGPPGYPFPNAEEEKKASPSPNLTLFWSFPAAGFSILATLRGDRAWKGFWENQDVWVVYPCLVRSWPRCFSRASACASLKWSDRTDLPTLERCPKS